MTEQNTGPVGRLLPIMVVLIALEVMSSLEANMIYTALPTIARETGGAQFSGWLIAGFALVQAVSAAIGGRLGDLYGRRLIMVAVCIICAAGSLVSATHSDIHWVVAGRAIQGVSGAILPLCYGIMRQLVPPARVPFWIGIFAGAYAASGALGFALGGTLTESIGWHAIFWVSSALPLLLLIPLLVVIPALSPVRDPQPLDLAGGLLFAVAIAGLLGALTFGKTWGWFSPLTLGTLAASVAVGAFWVFHEARCRNPLIDVRLLLIPEIALGNACFFLFGLSAMQMPLVVMALIQQPVWTGVGLGIGAAMTGLLKFPSSFVGMVGAPFGGLLSTSRSPRFSAVVGTTITTCGWLSVTLFHDTLIAVVIAMIVMGFGSAMILASVGAVIVSSAPQARTSEATGMAAVTRTVGLAAGAQLATVLLATSLYEQNGVSYPSPAAYALTLAVITGLTAACILVVLGLPRSRGKNPLRP